jgi:hypothetical protein
MRGSHSIAGQAKARSKEQEIGCRLGLTARLRPGLGVDVGGGDTSGTSECMVASEWLETIGDADTNASDGTEAE